MVMHTPELRKLLHRGVSEVIVEADLLALLEAGKPLRLKQGFDPTRPDLHLGHAVGLRKLRQLQELGHEVILIIGDWTAQIGDPSGQSATRQMLTVEEVRANAETYLAQFFKIVDPTRTRPVFQSEWYGSFGLTDVISLTSRFTVAQLLQREDFSKRFDANKPIAITELLYPLLQAYDSVAIESDVEFGGTDQKFNILLGRELQSQVGQRPQQALLVPILTGTDGSQKMSKSLDNYIGVDEPADVMYGKLMSIPDHLIPEYFELVTDIPDAELQAVRAKLAEGNVNPMDLKHRLATEITTQFHSAEAAAAGADEFRRVHQRRELPTEIPVARVSAAWFTTGGTPDDLVFEAGLAVSKSEAKRLVKQGGVRLGGEKLSDARVTVTEGAVLQVGRRSFARLERT